MECDMVVALGGACVGGEHLFGLNLHGPGLEWPVIRRLPAAHHPLGSTLRLGPHTLPQPRQTHLVLGCGPRQGWGFTHGVNEHQVAIGLANWRTRIRSQQPGLRGADVVRLVLERSRSACQALDILTDLIHRYGQQDLETGRDHIFLIADPREAMLVEAAGSHWAVLDCHQVRAASDAAMIRQDWKRVAPGLSELAIAQGWWRHDGSKLDFCGCLSEAEAGDATALKRWGRASLLLEQQNGHIDPWFLRRMLADHFDGLVARMSPRAELAATFLSVLSPDPAAVPMAWVSFGGPARAMYFPIFLDGDLPTVLQESNVEGNRFVRLPHDLEAIVADREQLDRWQDEVDQRTEQFLAQARLLKVQQNKAQLQRQATLFMQELIEATPSFPTRRRSRTRPMDDLAYVAE